jgi:hypothetical protein
MIDARTRVVGHRTKRGSATGLLPPVVFSSVRGGSKIFTVTDAAATMQTRET